MSRSKYQETKWFLLLGTCALLLLGGCGDYFVDTTFHVEIGFADVIEFAIEDHLEATDRFL